MKETFELLEQLNWFLKPLSDFILYFFTNGTGISILIGFFFLYIFLTIFNALRVRQLAHKASSTENKQGTPIIEKIYIIGSVFSKIVFNIIKNIPILLAVFVFLLFVVGMSTGIRSMGDFFENQKRIKELKSVIKQLDKRYKVAEINVKKIDYISNTCDLEVRFYNYSNFTFNDNVQKIKIKGTDIYFDAIIMNFDYSEISSGKKTNLVIPYRIFSNHISQDKGFKLELYDENNVPYIFKRSNDNVYGMPSEKFNKRVSEILELITNRDKARSEGVRSVYGNAVHKIVNEGELISIWVEQTGGMVIKTEEQF